MATHQTPNNPMAPDNPVGGSIISLVDSHSKAVAAKLRAIGLYRGQELLLKALADAENGRSQNDLATQLCLDHSSITKSVGRMEKAGYVQREKSTTDRRITLVRITPAGQALLMQAEKIWQTIETDATTGLTPTEVKTFLQLAQRITVNLTNV